VFKLWHLNDREQSDVIFEGQKDVGKVEEKTDDGQRDSQNATPEDDVHRQEVLASFSQHVNLKKLAFISFLRKHMSKLHNFI
jgi:hypothetical protein